MVRRSWGRRSRGSRWEVYRRCIGSNINSSVKEHHTFGINIAFLVGIADRIESSEVTNIFLYRYRLHCDICISVEKHGSSWELQC